MAAPQPVTSTTPQRLPLRGDTMAEQLAGLRLPAGYRMWLSKHTARIRHATKRTGADLEDFTAWLERILPEKLRIECADGWVVVSGMPSDPHQRAIARLDSTLFHVAEANEWRREQRTKIWRAPVRDYLEPDLVLVPWDVAGLDGQACFHGHDVVLVTEVTSKDSLQDDRVNKRIFFARTGVPRYLLIDLHAREAALFTDPVDSDYQATTRMPLGKPLHLPEPIGITLDTGLLIG